MLDMLNSLVSLHQCLKNRYGMVFQNFWPS